MRKALNDRCSRFNIKNELMIIAAALSFGFTLMLFSPTEFYADNPAAFMVEYRIFAVPMLGFAVLTSAAVVVLLNILLYIKEELYSVFTRILLGLLLAFFAQSENSFRPTSLVSTTLHARSIRLGRSSLGPTPSSHL